MVISKLVGLTKEEAVILCLQEGVKFRILREDDVDKFGAMDVRSDRVNVEVKDGYVVKVINVG